MAQKLINSLKFSANGDEYVVSLPTVTGTPASGVLTISNADTANIVLEEGAMFNYIGHCTGTGTSATPFSLNSITSIKIGSTSYNVVKGEGLTTVYGPVTYLYSGGKWRVVESHKHSAAEVGAAPANHTHELDIEDHTFTPAGTVTATFNGTSATITSSAPSSTITAVTGATLTKGTFTPNTPTYVTSTPKTVVTGLTGSYKEVVTSVSLLASSDTSHQHSVLKSASLSGSVNGKCLTLSINNSDTADILSAFALSITSTTATVQETVNGLTGSAAGPITVTAGSAASYTLPSLTVNTGLVAASAHTHTTTHKPAGTISATFSGSTQTLEHTTSNGAVIVPDEPSQS